MESLIKCSAAEEGIPHGGELPTECGSVSCSCEQNDKLNLHAGYKIANIYAYVTVTSVDVRQQNCDTWSLIHDFASFYRTVNLFSNVIIDY